MTRAYQRLLLKQEDGILTITLNQPARRNAMDGTMHRELPLALAEAARDDSVRVIVLTGAPEGKGFCAGGDLNWVHEAAQSGEGYDQVLREGVEVLRAITSARQPVIAMVNGAAIGIGATLALFCDVCFMDEKARIADPHVGIGVVAGDGGAIIWPLLLGPNRAKEFLMTGDALTGTEAAAIGLVNHAVPAAELTERTYAFARRLATGPRLAIELTKRAVNMHLERTMAGMIDASLALEGLTFRTADHDEAIRAFFAGEKPQFGKGRPS
jgi:enoyl-CoA hydratase